MTTLQTMGALLEREEAGMAQHPTSNDGPQIVCAWCQELYGWPKRANQSHGICAAHKAAMLAQLEALKEIK